MMGRLMVTLTYAVGTNSTEGYAPWVLSLICDPLLAGVKEPTSRRHMVDFMAY